MDRLKQLRKQKGLSQENIARIAGISLSTVSKIEQGKLDIKNSGYKTLEALADVFSVSVDYLVGKSDRR